MYAVLGLTAGYRGGWPDEIIMRLLDAMMSIPVILLYLIIVAAMGASASNEIPQDLRDEMALNLLRFHGCGTGRILDDEDVEDLDEAPEDEVEAAEDEFLDQTTAAATVAELKI